MHKPTKLLAVLIGGFLLLSACSGTSGNNPILEEIVSTAAPNEEQAAVVITPGIKDNTVLLKVGKVFEIQIPTIPIPNLTWGVKEIDSAILVQVGGSDYVPDTSPDSAGGITSLQFKAIAPGSTILKLQYAQDSKDATSISAQILVITVNVE